MNNKRLKKIEGDINHLTNLKIKKTISKLCKGWHYFYYLLGAHMIYADETAVFGSFNLYIHR